MYTLYHSGDFIIPPFSKEGELKSLERVEKDYSSKNVWAVSYKYASLNNKIYLVYNDHKILIKERI